MIDLTVGSAFRSPSIALKQASTFVDVRHFLKSIFCKIEALPNLLPLPSLFTRATRFVTTSASEPTIEQQMFRLQEKKRLVFEGTVDGSAASFSKLTLEDLAFLFHRGSRP